jgi:hypothetical protein
MNETPQTQSESDRQTDVCTDDLQTVRVFRAHPLWWLMPCGILVAAMAVGCFSTHVAGIVFAAGLVIAGTVSAAFVSQRIRLTSDGIELSVPVLELRFVAWHEISKVQYSRGPGLLYVHRRGRWLPWIIRIGMYGHRAVELSKLASARAKAATAAGLNSE